MSKEEKEKANQKLGKNLILNCKQALLTIPPRAKTIDNTKLSNCRWIIQVRGKRQVGKTYIVNKLKFITSNTINGVNIDIREICQVNNDPIPSEVKCIIVVINAYGFIEQDYIKSIYTVKPENCLLIVVLNYYAIKKFEFIYQAQAELSNLMNQHQIDNDHIYWSDEYCNYFLLINDLSTAVYYSQNVLFKLIETMSSFFSITDSLVNIFDSVKEETELAYRYYRECNDYFVIEIENKEGVSNINIGAQLNNDEVQFTVNYNKNNSKRDLVIKVPYSIASIVSTKSQSSFMDGVQIWKFDVLSNKSFEINVVNDVKKNNKG